MEESLSSLLSVSIDFEESHLFFPTIINWLLVILFAVIVIFKTVPFLKEVKAGNKTLPFVGEDLDKFKLFGTIVLLIIYFYLMDVVGRMFPYTGYGFLFTSIVFIFVLALLYLPRRTQKDYITITVMSVLSPALAWFVFAQLFNITLP